MVLLVDFELPQGYTPAAELTLGYTAAAHQLAGNETGVIVGDGMGGQGEGEGGGEGGGGRRGGGASWGDGGG